MYSEPEVRELLAATLDHAKRGKANIISRQTICAHLRYKGSDPVVSIFADQSADIDGQEIHLTEHEYYQAVIVWDNA